MLFLSLIKFKKYVNYNIINTLFHQFVYRIFIINTFTFERLKRLYDRNSNKIKNHYKTLHNILISNLSKLSMNRFSAKKLHMLE